MKPGVSGQSEIEAFFARLGVDPSDIDTHDAELPDLSMSSAYFEDFPHQFPGLPPRVSVLSSSNGVTSIQLEGLHPDFIAPSDVISALGTPEEIVIWIDSRIELRYFTLILRHPQHHTSVFVSGNLVPNEDYTDELLCIKDEAATSTDVLFYADPSDAYHEVSLLEDYPVTPQMIEQETQYEWISLPQTPGLQLRLEEAAQILARKEACLPPLQ